MSSKLDVNQLNSLFVADLENRVKSFSVLEDKPVDVVLKSPMRPLRAYIYNLTKPPGGRSENEYKIQIIVPGQPRGERGNFDMSSPDHLIMLVGYEQNFGVWVLWDAYLYRDFSYSRNVQVRAPTLIKAASSGIGEQERQTKAGLEKVIACSRRNLVHAVQLRASLWAQDAVRRA